MSMLRAIALGSLLALAIPVAQAGITGDKPTGMATGKRQFYATNGGNPIYQETGAGGDNPLYQGLIQVTPPGFSNVGYPSLDSKGNFAFQSIGNSPDTTGIFVRSAGGGVPLTIHGSNFGDASGAPILTDSGDVIFKSIDAAGQPEILIARAAGGGITGTFPSSFAPQMTGAPSANRAGDIAIAGQTDAGQSAIFVRAADGSSVITLQGSNFLVSNPQITENRVVAVATYADGSTQIVSTPRRASTIGLAYEPDWPDRFTQPEMNTRTQFAILLGNDNSTAAPSGAIAINDNGGIFILCGETTHFRPGPRDGLVLTSQTIIQIGDELDGAIVTDLALAPQSWASDVSLYFYAAFDDGTGGIYLWTLPEPATLAAFATLVPLARRRRHD